MHNSSMVIDDNVKTERRHFCSEKLNISNTGTAQRRVETGETLACRADGIVFFSLVALIHYMDLPPQIPKKICSKHYR